MGNNLYNRSVNIKKELKEYSMVDLVGLQQAWVSLVVPVLAVSRGLPTTSSAHTDQLQSPALGSTTLQGCRGKIFDVRTSENIC